MKPADAPEARRQPLQCLALYLGLLLALTGFAACTGNTVGPALKPTTDLTAETSETTRYPSTATLVPSPFTATPVNPTATVRPTSVPPTATAQPTSVPPTPTTQPTDVPATATVQPTSVSSTAAAPDTPIVTLATPVTGETPTAQPTPAIDAPVVTVGDTSFVVELAVTPAERNRGLSGHPPLADNEGMLFVFENEAKWTFWMKEMLFPLDMLWIDAGCTVVDITENALKPEPGQALQDLPRYFPKTLAQYVLEVNSGTAERTGISAGDQITFAGSLDGRFGC